MGGRAVRDGPIDAIERQIIDQLREDGRLSNREVARRLGVSEGTVRAHIRRLEEEQLMRVTAITNLRALGMRAAAHVGVFVEPGRAREVAGLMAGIHEVTFVATTFGEYDVIAVVLVETQEQLLDVLSETIARIPGVRRTETMEILQAIHHDYTYARLKTP
jgi:Lrp/AsnC family transcriptional regulator for asnA, asnC and gidA